jgi:AAA domain
MKVNQGKIDTPFFIILYGAAGVGKSTLASYAPNPIFLDVENGTKKLDVNRISSIKDFDEFIECFKLDEIKQYDTIVIDSIDFLEQMIFEHVCKKHGKKTITDFGYGQGFEIAKKKWASLLKSLKNLVENENKNIIFIAHEQIKRFDNPLAESFDRYSLRLNQKSSSYIVAQVDAVLFVSKSFTFKELEDKRKIPREEMGRKIYTQETASILAKSRYSLNSVITIGNSKDEYLRFYSLLK